MLYLIDLNGIVVLWKIQDFSSFQKFLAQAHRHVLLHSDIIFDYHRLVYLRHDKFKYHNLHIYLYIRLDRLDFFEFVKHV